MTTPLLHRSLVFINLLSSAILATAQITIEPMPPLVVCGSPTLEVEYTVNDPFGPGNVFTVELSDAVGSFDTPTSIGTVAATTSGAVPCTFPAGLTVGTGRAIRIVASDPSTIGVAYVLPITTVEPPNAGLDNFMSFCSSDQPVILIQHVGGMPDQGGYWTSPAGSAHSGIFVPDVDPAGCYTYTVMGFAPCASDVSTHCIVVSQAADAGISATDVVCSSDPAFLLRDRLGGEPQVGGAWAFGGAPHSPVFVPGVDPPGCYQYTVAGIAPCLDATSLLCIVVENCVPTGIEQVVEPGSSMHVVGGWNTDRPIISLPADVGQSAMLSIVDITGRTHASKKVHAFSRGSGIEWDVSALAHGVYSIQLVDDARSWVLRLWKE